MPNVYEGGCRCRTIRYRCNGEPLDARVCHCRDCQYASGSAFSAVAYFPSAQVEMSGATRHYDVKGTVGLTVARHFCPQCGTPLYSRLVEMPDLMFVKIGSLDSPGAVVPKGHMWCDSMLGWLRIDDGLERLPGNPPL